MKTAVLAPSYPPAFRSGGPVRSIEAMVRVNDGREPLVVLTSDRDLGVRDPLPVARNQWTDRDDTRVYYATVSSISSLWRAMTALRAERPSLLHLNSFFNPVFSIVPVMLWRFGFFGSALLVISPRGEFGSAALSRRSAKKRAYLAVFGLLRVNRSTIWHATANHEAVDIRRVWGDHARIVRRDNDTLLPRTAPQPARPTQAAALRAVFLGRIVEHKGLAIALEALQQSTAPIDVDVYGAEEDVEYFGRCKELAKAVSPEVVVRFEGAVPHERVPEILSAYDVLLMPTAGENFGHVIAEALSQAVPVLAPPTTPWTEVLSGGGGTGVRSGTTVPDRTPAAWRRTLEEYATAAPGELLRRREAAGAAYDRWASASSPPSVWALARALNAAEATT